MFFDPLQILFAIPGIIIGLIAQVLLSSAYGSNSRVNAGTNMTGNDAARLINDRENFGVDFKVTPGKLNDYYNPVEHVVNLSEDNASNMSVANIAVVAHEFGHVQQKHDGSSLFQIRSFMVPVVNIGSNLGFILIFIGFLIGLSGLIWLGVGLFALTTVFSLITLPIELDASNRGMKLIEKYNLISSENYSGARSVLNAAALTYFAALIASIGQLLYFVMLAQGNRRD